jgi:transposase InsO family protein
VIIEGWSAAEAAEAQGVSRTTAYRYLRRFRRDGMAGLLDRSSAPHRRPGAVSDAQERLICALRRETGYGPHRLAGLLEMPRSTVYAVLRRHGLQRLSQLDRTTRSSIRYEKGAPGELVHLDVKKLGRVPDGGGKRMDPGFAQTGIGAHRPGRRRGHDALHVAVDDHSRFAYVEALPDERGTTTAGFLQRATLAFAAEGIAVRSLLTDNGKNYTASRAFQETVEGLNLTHHRTRPYRPQTNGKAEAFIKTLQREWAYARPYLTNEARLLALQPFVEHYNRCRPHTACGGLPPMSRLVNNVHGNYI